MDFLTEKFDNFAGRFGKRLTGMELGDTVQKYMDIREKEIPKYVAELFSMRCKALAGELLLEEKGLKLQTDVAF